LRTGPYRRGLQAPGSDILTTHKEGPLHMTAPTPQELEEIEERFAEKFAIASLKRGTNPDATVHEAYDTDLAKRAMMILLCEKMLDSGEPFTDEQWTKFCFVVQYGGRFKKVVES
jgi:hypothetical protein